MTEDELVSTPLETSPASMLDLRVLGPIEARRDGQSVNLGGPQQRRVLAVLLADAGQVVALDRLVDAIWSDEPPDGCRRTVMTYVSRLRAAVGDGVVETIDPGYRLVPTGGTVDAARFEQLVAEARRMPPSQAIAVLDEALSLWSGQAFGEFAEEWWALPHATRLDELRLVATEERIEALLSVGEHSRAIGDLEQLVAAYPLRERLVGQLMRALDGDGRRAEALRAYQAHHQFLVEETGLDPSAALRELEQSIINGSPVAPSSASRVLRGYVLGDVLGQGAFGTVYKSVQPGIDREVAVKVIRADLADDPTFVRRFEAEAQLVAHLEHPHVVPLYDFWREPGGAYLVFRLLRGGSCETSLIEDGPWALDRVARLVDEIGGALVAAHHNGIVHRDVKPANVLFDETGNAYLADFGIAITGATSRDDESPAFSAGSPLYAPPEQFRRDEPTPLNDQYSFGALIFELLTGSAPFDGTSASEILRVKLDRAVPSLRDRRPDVPSGLDGVLQRATSSRSEDRYPELAQMIEAFRTAVRAGSTTSDLSPSDAPSRRSLDVASTVAALTGSAVNPYLGLRSFGEADARNFRGRSELVRQLFDDLQSSGFVAVVGASGSGKSSLVHAGLVPLLRETGDRVASMVPGTDPLAQLRLALLTVATREPNGTETAELVRSVANEGGGVLTLVVDQFEELWTLTDDDARRSFLTGLTMVAKAVAAAPVRIVLTVRADFFDRPLADPDLGSLVGANTFPVTPMTAGELHEAVTGPATAAGVAFEPGLDSAIVADVVNQPASLPLLQFTLAELFERRSGAVVTTASYRELGGVAGAIGARAESLYEGLDAAGRDQTKRLMLRMVVPGDGTEDTRRRVRHSELPPGAGAIARLFETNRLLVADRDPTTREPTIEVAHESLLRSWPRLRDWLLEDRDSLRQLQHLGAAARQWVEADRAESELYRGARLDGAAELADARPDQLTPVEAEFVDASVVAANATALRDRRVRRRLQRLLAGTAVALVLALVAGAVALTQRRHANAKADEADVSRLVSLSQSLAVSKRDTAALLALEASRRDPSAATDGALMTALYSDPSFLGDVRVNGLISSGLSGLSVSPDGKYLWLSSQTHGEMPVRVTLADGAQRRVTIPNLGDHPYWLVVPVDDHRVLVSYDLGDADSADGLDLVDTDSSTTIASIRYGEDIADLQVSPDGTRVAVTGPGTDTTAAVVKVLALPTLEVVASVQQPGSFEPAERSPWYSASVWADNDRLVVGSPSGRLMIWKPASDEVVQRINDPPPEVGGSVANILKVSPDGSTLVAVSAEADGMMAFDLATGAAKWSRPVMVNGQFGIDQINGVVYAQEVGGGSSRLIGLDLATGERTGRVLDGQHGSACNVATSPDGTTLYLASCNEPSVARWSLDGHTPTGAPVAGRGFGTGADVWSPDGTLIGVYDASTGLNAAVDVRSGEIVTDPAGGQGSGYYFQHDGRVVDIERDNDRILIYDPRKTDVREIDVDVPDRFGAAAWTDDGRVLAMGDGAEDLVVVVDLRSGKELHRLHTDNGRILGLAVSPDGSRLYVAGQSEETHVYALPSEQLVGTLERTANVALSPDGKLLAGNAFNGVVTFYDPMTLKPVGDPITGATAFVNVMQFTYDSRTLITSGLDNTMRFWDVATRRQVGPGVPVTVSGAAISPDSKTIAITTDVGVQRLALDRARLRRAACRSAARNLSTDEWRQYVGGTPVRLCPDAPPGD